MKRRQEGQGGAGGGGDLSMSSTDLHFERISLSVMLKEKEQLRAVAPHQGHFAKGPSGNICRYFWLP